MREAIAFGLIAAFWGVAILGATLFVLGMFSTGLGPLTAGAP